MATPSLPFSLASLNTIQAKLVVNHFCCSDPETQHITGHVYSTPLVYPMDPKFFAVGCMRVRDYLKAHHIPDKIIFIREASHIARHKDGSISLTGQDCLSIKISGDALGYLNEELIKELLLQFYNEKTFLINFRTIF